MHALVAHLYHLAEHVAFHPIWRAPAASFLSALLLRLGWRRGRALAVPLALLAGWLALLAPAISLLPAKPVDRLPGLALILLLHAWLSPRAPSRAAFLRVPALAVAAAWWMAGAPFTGAGLASCVPVMLGVWAALALTGKLAAGNSGWTILAASTALAGAIFMAGGAPHWAWAALVPGCAGLAFIGMPESVPPLAFAVMLTGSLTILASDRGRFLPVDVAVLAPLLVWFITPRLQPRLDRAGPALAAFVAALGGVALTVGAMWMLALR